MNNRRKEQEERLIPALLRIPHRAAVVRIVEEIAAAGHNGLRPPHMVVFQYMRPEGIRLTDLAEDAQMTKQSMSYIVDYLEKHGYVERAPDPTDGRAQLIRLTDLGKEVNQNARATARGLEAEWANHIGKDQMENLRHLLKEIISMLEEQAGIMK